MKIAPKVWLVASAWMALATTAQALELSEVMGLLAQTRAGEARFVEQRFVQGLVRPLRASGTLSFEAPDRFTRVTEAPRAEAMSVEGNTVTLTRDGRSRRMALDSVPEMAAVVDAVRGTLTGDGAALERHFRPQVSGNLAQWEVRMAPLDPQLAGQVRAINIGGQRGEVRSVEVMMADGDRSQMVIEPIAARPAQ